MTEPPVNAVCSAATSLHCAACAVRALDAVALRMPMNPASSDSAAPQTKLTDTRQPMDGSSRNSSASAATNSTTMPYSLFKNAMAPSRMNPAISATFVFSMRVLLF